MKKSFLLAIVLVLSGQTFAANHNGYIIKYRKGIKLKKSFNNSKAINTSFGTFAVVSEDSVMAEKDLASDPSIEYIEPNYIYTAIDFEEGETINDPKFAKQWGLNNTGKNSGGWFSKGKAGEDVNAQKAWEITTGSKDVIIAVIDTGIDYTHPDLKDNMFANDAELNGEEGVDDDGNGYVDDIWGYDFANKDANPMDGHGHGTHCAGVIGAKHNDQGVRGVMDNVKLIGIKFLSDSGSGDTEGAISSINYAIARGVHIMSNSWGGGDKSQALQDAIQAASDAGIIFVAASGNESNNNDSRPSFPASYEVDNIITVGAMSGKGSKASFSNYGKTSVDVFAPGVGILSTVTRGRYKNMSGTSMACPMVSGVLGLLLSNEPGLSVSEVKERVMSTAVVNSSLEKYNGSGRVDAYRMLENITN